MVVSIESIRDGDGEQRHDLARQAFGGADPFDADQPVPDPHRVVCAYDGTAILGTVVTLGFDMWWGGRAVPCGGVSGVVIRPEARGRGLARALLRESLDRMMARGEALAALYPTTATLYRGVGFEVAGSHEWRKVPLGLVPTAPAEALAWRRADFDDPVIVAIYDDMASGLDGWIRADEFWWSRMRHRQVKETAKNRYAYLGARGGEDVATVVYRYDSSSDRLYELGVELIAGTDGAAVAGALGFLAQNGTTSGHLETTLAGSVLSLHVPNVQLTEVTSDWPWMLRLVDVASAFAGRRWPVAVSGRVHLDIGDDTRPPNSGSHVLEFHGGSASVTPGGSGAVDMPVTELAAIYAGADVRLRHRSGRLAGATPADLELLTAACASSPTMPFFF